MRISDWSSDVCSSAAPAAALGPGLVPHQLPGRRVEVDLADGCTRSGAAEGPGTEHGELVGERGQRDRPPLAEAADLVLRGHPGVGPEHPRPEERRVGKEWVRTCRSQWSRD